jgi:predicted RNA-binding Zn-ribbon protein involved in translation (DUF1610 family)
MQAALQIECNEHDDPFQCPDCLIAYNDAFDQFGLIIHDGGRDVVAIRYCPWCGAALANRRAMTNESEKTP